MALTFITTEDLLTDIQQTFLDIISQESDENIERAEASAISKMASYLRNRFNTDLIFDPAEEYGDKELIKEFLCSLIRYRLWRSVAPRNVSQQVKDDYNEVMDWLEGIATNTIHPNLPHLTDEDDRRTDQAVWGGDNEPENFSF